MTGVAVSLVTYHTPLDVIERCGRAIVASKGGSHRVRVVVNDDTGESEAVRGVLRECGIQDVEVIGCPQNLGYAGGHNLNLAALFGSGATHVMVLNPDVVLAPDCLRLLEASTPPLALSGPLLELADEDGRPEGLIDTSGIVWTWGGRHLDAQQGSALSEAPTSPIWVAGISGACLLVSAHVHDHITHVCGEFFDGDFVAYREDAELAFRAGLLGVPSMLAPGARGLHGRALRGTRRGSSTHVDRLGVRNRFLIALKYGRRRPTGVFGPVLRDAVVLVGVLVRERSSWSGVVEAWRLRSSMRAKGRVVLAHATRSPRDAVKPWTGASLG